MPAEFVVLKLASFILAKPDDMTTLQVVAATEALASHKGAVFRLPDPPADQPLEDGCAADTEAGTI